MKWLMRKFYDANAGGGGQQQPANTQEPAAQQQGGAPDWAKQLAQQMNDKQQGAQQPAQQQQATAQVEPAAVDFGKADPERLSKDARFYASQPEAVWQLIKDTYEEARGGVASSRIEKMEARQGEFELRAIRAEAARDFNLTAEETEMFLTGTSPELISQQAKFVRDFKAQSQQGNETKSQGAQQQGVTATQQQSANNQTQLKQDDKGNIIIVPGNYPDTRSPMDIAKAALAEKAAKGESFYQ